MFPALVPEPVVEPALELDPPDPLGVGEEVVPELIPGSAKVAADLGASDAAAAGLEEFLAKTATGVLEESELAGTIETVCAEAGPSGWFDSATPGLRLSEEVGWASGPVANCVKTS